MPTPAPTSNGISSEPYQFKNRGRFSFLLSKYKGRKRKFLILFGAILLASVLAYITTVNQEFIREFIPGETRTDDVQIINKETGELTDEAINNISDVTIEQVKEASVSTGVNPLNSPSLSDSETSKKIYQEIGNDDPQNHIVAYSDFGISLPSIEIKQGDLVTWVNNSTEPMSVVGDGWQSRIPREPDDQFSYGFVFLGEYKYKINDGAEGVVVVVSN